MGRGDDKEKDEHHETKRIKDKEKEKEMRRESKDKERRADDNAKEKCAEDKKPDKGHDERSKEAGKDAKRTKNICDGSSKRLDSSSTAEDKTAKHSSREKLPGSSGNEKNTEKEKKSATNRDKGNLDSGFERIMKEYGDMFSKKAEEKKKKKDVRTEGTRKGD